MARQNTARPDADHVLYVLRLTVLANLSESCDKRSQMCGSPRVVALVTHKLLDSAVRKVQRGQRESAALRLAAKL